MHQPVEKCEIHCSDRVSYLSEPHPGKPVSCDSKQVQSARPAPPCGIIPAFLPPPTPPIDEAGGPDHNGVSTHGNCILEKERKGATNETSEISRCCRMCVFFHCILPAGLGTDACCPILPTLQSCHSLCLCRGRLLDEACVFSEEKSPVVEDAFPPTGARRIFARGGWPERPHGSPLR